MLLPCRHVFALRKVLGKPLYDPYLVDMCILPISDLHKEYLLVHLLHHWPLQHQSQRIAENLVYMKNHKAVVLTSELCSICCKWCFICSISKTNQSFKKIIEIREISLVARSWGRYVLVLLVC